MKYGASAGSEKGFHYVTMFSRKPEFNLPEFLAKWGPGTATDAARARAKFKKNTLPTTRQTASNPDKAQKEAADTGS